MVSDEHENWLDAKVVQCPSCKVPIFQIVHSPFIEAWRIYCNRCPRSVEVSFYDEAVEPVWERFNATGDREQLFREIESMLRPCDCGGAFKFEASRRCFLCHGVVTEATHVDVDPVFGGELEEREPTEEEEELYEEYRQDFIREDDLWR